MKSRSELVQPFRKLDTDKNHKKAFVIITVLVYLDLLDKLFFRFDHPNVCEGQGTVGMEIIEQVPDVDAVLLPTGGGSLLAGAATAIKALKPECEVYVSGHPPLCIDVLNTSFYSRLVLAAPTTASSPARVEFYLKK